MPNCWTANGANGSTFHEVIVLPTVAPEPARPQNLGPYQGQQVTESGSSEWYTPFYINADHLYRWSDNHTLCRDVIVDLSLSIVFTALLCQSIAPEAL